MAKYGNHFAHVSSLRNRLDERMGDRFDEKSIKDAFKSEVERVREMNDPDINGYLNKLELIEEYEFSYLKKSNKKEIEFALYEVIVEFRSAGHHEFNRLNDMD